MYTSAAGINALVAYDQQHATTEDRVWGTAYRIIPEKVAEVQAYLDIREINGYSMQYTEFRPADPKARMIRCLVYIGLPDNPQFIGPQNPQALAEHISNSIGPSGENKEYLFMLQRALDELGEESRDAHVNELACRLREIERGSSKDCSSVDAEPAIEK